jgi:hypothetical protein
MLLLLDQINDSKQIASLVRRNNSEQNEKVRIKSVHTGAIGTVLGRHDSYQWLWEVEFDAPEPDNPESKPYVSWLRDEDMLKIVDSKTDVEKENSKKKKPKSKYDLSVKF